MVSANNNPYYVAITSVAQAPTSHSMSVVHEGSEPAGRSARRNVNTRGNDIRRRAWKRFRLNASELNPHPVGRRRGAPPLHEISRPRRGRISDRDAPRFAPDRSGQAEFGHQPPGGTAGHCDALTVQCEPHFASSVHAVIGRVHTHDLGFEGLSITEPGPHRSITERARIGHASEKVCRTASRLYSCHITGIPRSIQRSTE
jgi:hypothetical protein